VRLHSALSTARIAAKPPWRPRGVPTPKSVRSPETEIEGGGVHEQPHEHVFVPAHMRATETASLIVMSTRSLEQLPAFPKESFPAVAADTTPIRIDRVAFGLLMIHDRDPRSGSLM
jgi:hypothetical protein